MENSKIENGQKIYVKDLQEYGTVVNMENETYTVNMDDGTVLFTREKNFEPVFEPTINQSVILKEQSGYMESFDEEPCNVLIDEENVEKNNTHEMEPMMIQMVSFMIPMKKGGTIVEEKTVKDLVDTEISLKLKNIWENFVFRKVKLVKRNNKDVASVKHWYIDSIVDSNFSTSLLKFESYKSLEDAVRNVPEKSKHRNFEVIYKKFHGYTNDQTIEKETVNVKDILFNNYGFSMLDFESDFKFPKFHVGDVPLPRNNQLLCGLVNKGKYTKWFVCSYQFHILWALICDRSSEILNENGNPKTLKQIYTELDTGKIWNMYNVPFDKRPLQFQRQVYERSAMEYTNAYQDVYSLCFDTEKRDMVTQRVKRNEKVDPIFKITPSFIDNAYQNLVL